MTVSAQTQRDRGRHASPDLAHTLCDWCELPVTGEVWDWHCTRGHPRCIVRAAVQVWVSRRIPGEMPPPIDHAALETTRKDGLCDWCFWLLGAEAMEFNGGRGHSECVAQVERILMPDAPGPVHIPRHVHVDQIAPFIERLGRAAVKHRLPTRRLERAIRAALDV